MYWEDRGEFIPVFRGSRKNAGFLATDGTWTKHGSEIEHRIQSAFSLISVPSVFHLWLFLVWVHGFNIV
jgi:hypothetical protein